MSNFNFNKAILGGRLTSTPELKTTPNGVMVTTFSIAINRKPQKDQTEQKADFINCVAFGKLAEVISKFCKKGQRIIVCGSLQIDSVEKDGNKRYGNHQKVRMELRFGEDQNVIPESVYVDYLMAPKQINLTQEEIDDYEDNSQIIEFPDYVVYEIINILVRLVLEQNSNPARI